MRYVVLAIALASLTGCALNGVVRFGGGEVSKPQLHGGVMVSGTK